MKVPTKNTARTISLNQPLPQKEDVMQTLAKVVLAKLMQPKPQQQNPQQEKQKQPTNPKEALDLHLSMIEGRKGVV